MKKKIMPLALGICVSLAVVGCGSVGVSDGNVKISQYKGVEVDRVDVVKVTDESVEAEITTLLEGEKETTPITDRTVVAEGDVATLDFEGKKDGVAFEGGAGKDYALTIGSGQFIPGFEEGVVGHSVGETFDIPITFPETYQKADLAGVPVVFTVTVNSIGVESVPELTDELVQTLSEKSKTVKEYKAEKKKEMEKTNKTTQEETLKTAVLAKVVENTKISKYPEDKLKKAKEDAKKQYQQMADAYQVELSELIKTQMSMTEEEFEKQIEDSAKETLKREMAIEAISKKEKLTLSKKELEKEYEAYAKKYNYDSVKALKEAGEKAGGENLLKTIVQGEKVVEWLTEKAKQVEPKKEEKKTETKEEKK